MVTRANFVKNAYLFLATSHSRLAVSEAGAVADYKSIYMHLTGSHFLFPLL